MEIAIGNWPTEIHTTHEQVKRMLSAKKLKEDDVVSVDLEKGEMRVQGSAPEPYDVTIESCTCVDFAVKKQPCKHIYSLASKMGLISLEEPIKKSSKNTKGMFSEDISKYRALYEQGEILADSYVKICTALEKAK